MRVNKIGSLDPAAHQCRQADTLGPPKAPDFEAKFVDGPAAGTVEGQMVLGGLLYQYDRDINGTITTCHSQSLIHPFTAYMLDDHAVYNTSKCTSACRPIATSSS